MSTETKKGFLKSLGNIFKPIREMGRALADILVGDSTQEEYSEEILPPELKNTLQALKVKEGQVVKGINSSSNGGTKNNFKPIINPKTEAAMRNKISQRPVKEKDGGERAE